jgi:exodeoxyribonuclease-5
MAVESVVGAYGDVIEAVVRTDDDTRIELMLYQPQFGHNPIHYKELPKDRSIIIADYGYCITCHKSQGSEWDKVLVIDEQCPQLWDAKRWRYTAITRAKQQLRYYW